MKTRAAVDIALQRNRYPHLTDEEFRFMVQQVAGRERLKDKLPTLVQQADWWFPDGLACEQCSSEQTARYKVQCLQRMTASVETVVDLTGGYGVDSFFLSASAREAHYVERNGDLCRIAAHNFAAARPHVSVHHTSAEEFLQTLPDAPAATLIYMDPARRGAAGNKVFRIEDCTPDVLALLPQLKAKGTWLMVKLSPMLDITAALRAMGMKWDVHVVAVNNEVKELLMLYSPDHEDAPCITAVNITGALEQPRWQVLSFTQQQEREAEVRYLSESSVPRYLYEPNAAVTKACAFRYVSGHYGLEKLSPNTHLYASSDLLTDFPGKVWEIVKVLSSSDLRHLSSLIGEDAGCAVLTRNYPLGAEQLRRKLKVREGDKWYIIGARVGDSPALFLARRIC